MLVKRNRRTFIGDVFISSDLWNI